MRHHPSDGNIPSVTGPTVLRGENTVGLLCIDRSK